jgi:hypothetical protein
MNNIWIKRISGHNEKIRMFCFPHAGAGAYVYSNWKDTLSKEIGLYAVQLPGREKRIREALISDAKTLCNQVVDNIKEANHYGQEGKTKIKRGGGNNAAELLCQSAVFQKEKS